MTFQLPAWPPEWPEIEDAINAAFNSGDWGRYRSDTQVQLATEISSRFHVPHVRLCCSGTAALEACLRAAGVGRGDEVIVSAFDYPGNYRTIELVAARPVLVDLEEQSFGLDPDQLDEAAGEQVRAVIVSHLYGTPASIQSIKTECESRGWVLIEDACQVPGMTIEGQSAGSFGHMSTLSFGGSKPLTAGNGGAILTKESRFSAKINAMLDRPSDTQPLSTLQAAVLLPQLKHLKSCNDTRIETIRHLEASVLESLTSWTWLSPLQDNVQPTHYKVAWAAKSPEHRAAIIRHAAELGLPIGEGFRSMSRSSERRCRKPVSLERAADLGERVFVLDHAALLLPPERHQDLADVLTTLERATRPTSRLK